VMRKHSTPPFGTLDVWSAMLKLFRLELVVNVR
jgi:hypothetical protein